MNSAALLIAMATFGVDVGWQELEDGSIEYIIQIEPQLVGSLRDGNDLTSGIPPALRNQISRYRVVGGSEKLTKSPPLDELQRRWDAEKAAAKAAAKQPAPPLEFTKDPPQPVEFPRDPKNDPGGVPPLNANPFAPPARDPDASNPDSDFTDPATNHKSDDPPSLHTGAQIPPKTFQPDDAQQPIQQVNGYREGSIPAPTGDAEEQDSTATSDAPPRRWGVLVAVLLALFASLGVNAFLGWIAVEQRGRYRSLLSKNATSEPVAG